MVARRKQKEETKRNIRLYKDNLKGDGKTHQSEANNTNASKAILINGKEFIIRVNTDMEDQKKSWHIINKLNSEKQKIKEMERSKDLMTEIEDTFNSFEQWHSTEKNSFTYVKIEEIEHKGWKKIKRKYINKEEYDKIHLKKWNLIMGMFSKNRK